MFISNVHSGQCTSTYIPLSIAIISNMFMDNFSRLVTRVDRFLISNQSDSCVEFDVGVNQRDHALGGQG